MFTPRGLFFGMACTTFCFLLPNCISWESTTWLNMKKIWVRNKKEWMRFGKRIHTWEITIENWTIQNKVWRMLRWSNLSRSFTCWPFSYLDFWIWLLEAQLSGLIQPKRSELQKLEIEIQFIYKTNQSSKLLI